MTIARPAASRPDSKPATRASRRARKRGFTLVELLAVIAIIAILVALLTPALFKVIRMARLASCAGSMHGVFMALAVYAGDNQNFVPTVAAYTRGSLPPSTGGGNCSIGMMGGKTYWFGALAKARAFDNLQLLICPGTQTWGQSDMHNSGLYENTGTVANPKYALRAATELDTFGGNMWGNYGLRWSGWWHKIYPNARLMLAEAVNSEQGDFPYYRELNIHGGDFYGDQGVNSSGLYVNVHPRNEPSMNICGSDGRVFTLQDYTGPTWQYYADSASSYYGCDDRNSDDVVAGQPGSSKISYPDEIHLNGDNGDPAVLSSAGVNNWTLWQRFDIEKFNGAAWPWGNSAGWWPPAGWQNP